MTPYLIYKSQKTHSFYTVRLKARGSDKEMGMSGRMLSHPEGKAIITKCST